MQLAVYIAEESYLIRKGLRGILEEFPQLKIIKETDQYEQVNNDLEEMLPDILFVGQDFIARGLCEEIDFEISFSSMKVIEITYRNGNFSRNSLSHKADKSEILKRIQDVIGNSERKENKKLRPWELSEREESVLKEIALGLTNKEIAEKMFISPHTVMTHRKNITKKLGIKSASGLTVYAILNQLIDPQDVNKPGQ